MLLPLSRPLCNVRKFHRCFRPYRRIVCRALVYNPRSFWKEKCLQGTKLSSFFKFKMVLERNCFHFFEHCHAVRVDVRKLYGPDFCTRLMLFPQTRLNVCCNPEHCGVLNKLPFWAPQRQCRILEKQWRRNGPFTRKWLSETIQSNDV